MSTFTVLGAGGIDLSSVTALVQSLATGLSTLILPLGIVGIVMGAAMVLIGYPHGANTIRTSAIAIVVGGLAKVIATALAGSAGG
jgi:hypothetical protein